DQSSEAIDDEVALAPITRRAAERASGLACDLGREPVGEIARHVAGEEQPRTGAHALRVLDIRAADRRRRDELHIDHRLLHYIVAAAQRAARRHCRSSFIDTRLGQPYGFSRVSPPLEAEFVAGEQPSQDLRWRASALRRAGRSRCRYLRRRVLLPARPLRLR